MIQFPIEVTSNTLVDYPRLELLRAMLKETEDLPGVVAEVGVYKGGTAYLLVSEAKKDVYLFDTFEGMPEVREDIDLHRAGDFADTSFAEVTNLLSGIKNRNWGVLKGLFPKDTGRHAANQLFSFVHLDVDIYDSVKDCLEFFYPRMVPGGIIVLDDYNEPNCPGAKLAADEFCANKPQKVIPTVQSQAIIRF